MNTRSRHCLWRDHAITPLLWCDGAITPLLWRDNAVTSLFVSLHFWLRTIPSLSVIAVECQECESVCVPSHPRPRQMPNTFGLMLIECIWTHSRLHPRPRQMTNATLNVFQVVGGHIEWRIQVCMHLSHLRLRFQVVRGCAECRMQVCMCSESSKAAPNAK